VKYKLSKDAEADLIRIHQRGVRDYGEAQADAYFLAFFERFEQIAAQPDMYPSVDWIRVGYRRSVYGVDSIFYRVVHGIVEIMSIIGRQDKDSIL
jgi:toxin ParE1/3/4